VGVTCAPGTSYPVLARQWTEVYDPVDCSGAVRPAGGWTMRIASCKLGANGPANGFHGEIGTRPSSSAVYPQTSESGGDILNCRRGHLGESTQAERAGGKVARGNVE
jgi:hypothetical protein